MPPGRLPLAHGKARGSPWLLLGLGLLVGLGLGLSWGCMRPQGQAGAPAAASGAAAPTLRAPDVSVPPCEQPAALSEQLPENSTDLPALLRRASTLSHPLVPHTVVVVEVNSGFLDFARNMWLRAGRTKPPLGNLLWVALDAQAHDQLKALPAQNGTGRPLVFFDPADKFEPGGTSFRTKAYNDIVKHKWTLLRRVLGLGFNALLLDVDVIVLRNPFGYLADLPACDLLATVDTLPDQGITNGSNPHRWAGGSQRYNTAWINTGVILWRATPTARALIDDFIAYKPAEQGMDDQHEWNAFLNVQPATPQARVNLPFLELASQCGVWGNLSVQILPPSLYGSQRHVFEFQLPQNSGETPYTIHFNWLSGAAEKRQKMQVLGLWLT